MDEKSGRARIEVLVGIGVGVRVGVDSCGRGVNEEICRGMVVAAAVEVSGIIVTGM
ncbi:hypothetical protein Tco_0587930, partial [Tanacetum coccineum]